MGHEQEEPVLPEGAVDESYVRQQQQLAVPQITPIDDASSSHSTVYDGAEDADNLADGSDGSSGTKTGKQVDETDPETRQDADFPPVKPSFTKRTPTMLTTATSMYAEEEGKKIDDIDRPDYPQRLWRW